MTHELIDIGANLTHDSFDDDRNEVVDRAVDAGVTMMILTGSSEQGSRDAAELADSRPDTFRATAGVHPHHASDYSEPVHSVLRDLTSRDSVVAVGECGLDYFRNFSPVEAQRSAFESQLLLASEAELPVFLHQRDAHDDFVGILEPALSGIPRAVAHCFTGNADALHRYLDLGLYIGVTGWVCDERRGRDLQNLVREIPLDRLMIETDAPYLLPRSLSPRPRTRRNEPMYLTEVLRVVAAAMGHSEQTVAAATTANARTFFGL